MGKLVILFLSKLDQHCAVPGIVFVQPVQHQAAVQEVSTMTGGMLDALHAVQNLHLLPSAAAAYTTCSGLAVDAGAAEICGLFGGPDQSNAA